MNGSFAYTLVLAINIIAGISVIGLVLMQHGKGADMGAAFGSGSSGSLFGATGSSNFLSKATGVLAAIFFVTCLGLNYLAGKTPQGTGSVIDTVKVEAPKSDVPTPSVPASDNKSSDVKK